MSSPRGRLADKLNIVPSMVAIVLASDSNRSQRPVCEL